MIRLRVKEIAEAKHLNMTTLSHKSLVSFNTIKAIFRDPTRTVNTDTLERLANALEVPVIELIEELPDQPLSPKNAW